MTEPSAVVGVLETDGMQLETLLWKPADAENSIILLHEALGSASYWKDFPSQLAAHTHCRVLAYSRAGHGSSKGPIQPRSFDYYRRQTSIVLPALMRRYEISQPILYGHSEGAAIAFLYAAEEGAATAIVAESPIVVPEEGTLQTVRQMEHPEASRQLIEKLSRYHRDAESVFRSWVEDVRMPLAHEFPATKLLPKIACPVLVVQGELDPFGYAGQAAALDAGVGNLERIVLPGVGHLPHREDAPAVIHAVTQFLRKIES